MSFRSLYHSLLEYEGQAAFDDLLRPWLDNNLPEIELLRSLGARTGAPIPTMSSEELWHLYAAHRVLELLALRFQAGSADGGEWPGPAVTEDEFRRFAQCIELDIVHPERWSPFHHEIVGLTPIADPARPARILKYHWPCLMLGPMLFMRAGVTVSAGSAHMAPGIADQSTLYWAHRRKTRPHQDLAHGWGSNSSWRTDFRRDYLLDGSFHFNVDGDIDLSKVPTGDVDDAGLSAQERRELLVNRCFVVCTKDHADLFPYDDRCSVKTD